MLKRQTVIESRIGEILNKYREMILDDFYHIGNEEGSFAFYLAENFREMYEELRNI